MATLPAAGEVNGTEVSTMDTWLPLTPVARVDGMKPSYMSTSCR
jgi:hypothetical protein